MMLVAAPTAGAAGSEDVAAIATTPDSGDLQPVAAATEKVNDPAGSPVRVVLVPVPAVVFPSGILVSIQVPVAGKLLSTTEPSDLSHVVPVIAPTRGSVGEAITVAISAVLAADVQPLLVAST